MDLDRRLVRYVGAAAAALMAVIYYLIAAGVLVVVTPTTQNDDMLVFGLMAGTAFLTGAALLVLFDVRILWIVGLLFQVFVVVTYVTVAPQRVPEYEPWGITLRLLQIPLMAALAYLAVRAPHPSVHLIASRSGVMS